MKLRTRIKLIKLAFSRKYSHIHWFTFQLRDKHDDGRYETFVQSHFDGVIQNTPEIIKARIQTTIDNREK